MTGDGDYADLVSTLLDAAMSAALPILAPAAALAVTIRVGRKVAKWGAITVVAAIAGTVLYRRIARIRQSRVIDGEAWQAPSQPAPPRRHPINDDDSAERCAFCGIHHHESAERMTVTRRGDCYRLVCGDCRRERETASSRR